MTGTVLLVKTAFAAFIFVPALWFSIAHRTIFPWILYALLMGYSLFRRGLGFIASSTYTALFTFLGYEQPKKATGKEGFGSWISAVVVSLAFFALFDMEKFDLEDVPLAGRAFLTGVCFMLLVAAESTLDILFARAKLAWNSGCAEEEPHAGKRGF